MLCILAFIPPPPLPRSSLSTASFLGQSDFKAHSARYSCGMKRSRAQDWAGERGGDCIAPVWQAGGRGAKLSRMQHRGDQQTADRTLQLHPFSSFFASHLHRGSSFSPLPREEGGGRIAELLLCGGCPSWTAQEPPGGDAAVQRRWAGRCVATGRGTAEWRRPRPLSSNAGSLGRGGISINIHVQRGEVLSLVFMSLVNDWGRYTFIKLQCQYLTSNLSGKLLLEVTYGVTGLSLIYICISVNTVCYFAIWAFFILQNIMKKKILGV